MDLIRPRLTDYHGIHRPKADLDFAIQFFDEDIPSYVDPFCYGNLLLSRIKLYTLPLRTPPNI